MLYWNKGDFFGHEELSKAIPYKCDAVCIGRTVILYVNKNKFEEYFANKDIKLLYQHFPEIDINKIYKAIEAKDILVKKNSQVVFDATNLNFSNFSGRIWAKEDDYIKRIQPWMNKAKLGLITDSGLLEYWKKIKVISTTTQTSEIKDPSTFEKQIDEYPKISFSKFSKDK